MSEQRTPDELNVENELICEKLLGWEVVSYEQHQKRWNDKNYRSAQFPLTPAFDTWADAGLILDALAQAGQRPDVSYYDKWYSFVDANCREGDEFPDAHESGPLAIRAAALEYIKAMKS